MVLRTIRGQQWVDQETSLTILEIYSLHISSYFLYQANMEKVNLYERVYKPKLNLINQLKDSILSFKINIWLIF